MIISTQAVSLYFIALTLSFFVYSLVRIMARAFFGRR